MRLLAHRSGKTGAFTLVELLVVVGVIAVLIAMLLPALRKAREQANAVACGSNLRQLWMACSQYAMENKGQVPSLKQYGSADSGYYCYYWKPLSATGYLGQGENYGGANGPRYKILRCPTDTGALLAAQPTTVPPMPMFDGPHNPSSYAMNSMVNYGAWFTYSYAKLGRNMMEGPPAYYFGRVNRAEQVSFVMDCPRWFAWGWSVPEYSYGIDSDPGDGWGIPGAVYYAFRHPGKRANILYYDGHTDAAQHFFTTGKRVWSWK